MTTRYEELEKLMKARNDRLIADGDGHYVGGFWEWRDGEWMRVKGSLGKPLPLPPEE